MDASALLLFLLLLLLAPSGTGVVKGDPTSLCPVPQRNLALLSPPSLPLRRQGVVFPSFLELRSELLSQDFSVLRHHFTDLDNIMKFIGAYNELS